MPLPHEVGHGFRGKSCAELLLQIQQLPTLLAQGDAGDKVLRQGRFDKAAHLIQGMPAHHKRSAGADHGPPAVPHWLDPAVKAFFIRQQPGFQPQVAHHRIGIDERLRGLQQSHVGLQQKADAALQEAVLGDEVRIENRHELAVATAKACIEIARLGMPPFGTTLIATAQAPGQLSHFLTTAVIQHPDRGVGIALLRAAQERALQHRQGFAVGGHQDVHMGSPVRGLPRLMATVGFLATVGEAAPGQP